MIDSFIANGESSSRLVSSNIEYGFTIMGLPSRSCLNSFELFARALPILFILPRIFRHGLITSFKTIVQHKYFFFNTDRFWDRRLVRHQTVNLFNIYADRITSLCLGQLPTGPASETTNWLLDFAKAPSLWAHEEKCAVSTFPRKPRRRRSRNI